MKTIAEKGISRTAKFKVLCLGLLTMLILLTANNPASAHCDGLDGPVVKAAQKALETNNVGLVLIWVKNNDESYIRSAFEKTIRLRKISPEIRELADTYFFETLVRLHRAGEGAPYTGLKPAGRDLGPAIPAADSAIASGSAKELWSLLSNSMHDNLHEKFVKTSQLKDYDPGNIEKGREFVNAYVAYVHLVEKLYGISGSESDHDIVPEDTGHKH